MWKLCINLPTRLWPVPNELGPDFFFSSKFEDNRTIGSVFALVRQVPCLLGCICCPKITPARCVWLDLKSPAILRKHLYHLRRHRDVRRFLGVLAGDFYFPASTLCAEQQRGRELRAVFNADACRP